MENKKPTEIEIVRAARVMAWFHDHSYMFRTDTMYGIDIIGNLHRLVCDCIAIENEYKGGRPIDKFYRVMYLSLIDHEMHSYELIAADRADAIHLTLRKYPEFIVFSAELM
jgi:hypothetical protein